MNIFSQDIDLLKKHDVFLHYASVFLFVHILVLLEHLPKIVDTVLKVLSAVCIFTMNVKVATLIFQFFLHVLLVQPDYTFSE